MPLGGQVVEKVLNPGVVGVAHRRDAGLPARVVAEQVPRSIRNADRRLSEDVVGLEVLVLVVEERVGPRWAQVGLDAADGEVHVGQLPGGRVGLLAEDGDVADAALVLLDESLRLDESRRAGTRATR